MTYEFSTKSENGADDLIGFMVELERQIMSSIYRGRIVISLPDLPEAVEDHEIED